MEEEVYPKIVATDGGWVVRATKGASLPGYYTNQASANRAIRRYLVNQELAKESREAKKKKKEASKKDK